MAFDVNDFYKSFSQFYGLGQQIGTRYDLNKMREAQVTGGGPVQGPAGGPNVGVPQTAPFEYLGQQFDAAPTSQQKRQAQQRERGDIFEKRGLFDQARSARAEADQMQSRSISDAMNRMTLDEKKRVTAANDMLTKALGGDVAALGTVLQQGAKYVTDDRTPMRVNLSDDGQSAIFQVGQGKPVTKKLSELKKPEIAAIVGRVRPGVLANASPQYAAFANQDYYQMEKFGLATQQYDTQVADAEKRFNEQVRQFNSTDKRIRKQATADQENWIKANNLNELRFDLADEKFQHDRAMSLEKLRNNQKLIDARIKDMQRKLRPAEWQHNWSIIRNPNSSPMEFALAAGINVDDVATNQQVLDAIISYQSTLAPIGPPQNSPNQQIQGVPQPQQQPFTPPGLPHTIGVPG